MKPFGSASHTEFPINGHRHRVGTRNSLPLTKLLPQPGVAGIPGVVDVAVGFPGHGADGFMKRWNMDQFCLDPLHPCRVRLSRRQAVQSSHQGVR